jgi:hypothetical protein
MYRFVTRLATARPAARCSSTGSGRRTGSSPPRVRGAVLGIRPFMTLASTDADAIVTQGAQLLEFAAGDAEGHDIKIAEPG